MVNPSLLPVLTVAQVKETFDVNGWTVTDWAQENGFDPQVVYALLNGRAQGRRCASYRAAVALGLKPKIDPEDLPDFLRPPAPK